MKESWLEKLIELINEYEVEKEKSEWVNVDAYVLFKWKWVWEWYLNKWLTRFDETDHWEWDNLYWDTAVAYLISKSFWMIKWLVDNDKIDLMKLKKWIEDNKFYCAKWGKITNMLLMLLSIQDNPIEFLISILK